MIQDLGTQLLRGSADVFEARFDGRLRFAESAACSGVASRARRLSRRSTPVIV